MTCSRAREREDMSRAREDRPTRPVDDRRDYHRNRKRVTREDDGAKVEHFTSQFTLKSKYYSMTV